MAHRGIWVGSDGVFGDAALVRYFRVNRDSMRDRGE
jgi:hypothetical protein